MTSTMTPAEQRANELVERIVRDYPDALVTAFGEGVVQAVRARRVDNSECWPRCDHPQLVKLTVLGPVHGAGATAYLSAKETYWLVGELIRLLEEMAADPAGEGEA